MGVWFNIKGHDWRADGRGRKRGDPEMYFPPDEMYVSISNATARDLLEWLGLPCEFLDGETPAAELGTLLRQRLFAEPGYVDPGIPPSSIGTLIDHGRPPGELNKYAERLLKLADYAGEGVIIWR